MISPEGVRVLQLRTDATVQLNKLSKVLDRVDPQFYTRGSIRYEQPFVVQRCKNTILSLRLRFTEAVFGYDIAACVVAQLWAGSQVGVRYDELELPLLPPQEMTLEESRRMLNADIAVLAKTPAWSNRRLKEATLLVLIMTEEQLGLRQRRILDADDDYLQAAGD